MSQAREGKVSAEVVLHHRAECAQTEVIQYATGSSQEGGGGKREGLTR